MGAKPRPNLYEFRVRRLRLRERPATYCKMREARDAARLLWSLTRQSPVERFYALYLDARNVMIGYELIATGTLTGVDVHPREVFRGAILASAAAIILGHNHPSGDVTPSDDDLELTRRMRAAGELLGIPVHDHVVVGEIPESFRSLICDASKSRTV